MIPDAIRSHFTGTPLRVRNPESTRPWQFVLEPLYGYILFLESILFQDCKEVTLNFGPNESPIRVKQVIEVISELLDINYFESPQSLAKLDSTESKDLSLNPSRAIEVLNWKPILSQLKGIEWTIDWYKNVNTGSDPLEETLKNIREFESKK